MQSEPDNKTVLSKDFWKVLGLERLDPIRIRIHQNKKRYNTSNDQYSNF